MPLTARQRRWPRLAATLAAAVASTTLSAGAQAQAAGSTRLERGAYLMKSIVACGNCHTPMGPNGPIAGRELAGGNVFDEKPFTAVASNLTPDPETGIGKWTDAQLATAIREGKRPDGTLIGPPMPVGLYRGLSDNDVAALIAYMRSLPPVKNAVAKSVYRIPLPPNYGPPVGKVADVPAGDKLALGRYLAGPAGHCMECHSTPGPNGVPDLANALGAGGMPFNGPWGVSIASNITPKGIGAYTDAQLKTVITTGVRPDGSRLKPPMGTAYYANMNAGDLDALVAYLRSLPSK